MTFEKEPAVYLGAISEVVKAVIPMLIIFSLIHWTSDQVAAVMLVVNVVVGSLTVVLTRAQTVPATTTDELIKIAVKSPSDTKVSEVKAIQEAKEG